MAQHDEHVHEHHIPLSTHIKVFAALVTLTILTVVTAKFTDFGVLNVFISFGIAITKALLVMAYFMHLKYDEKVYRIVISMAFGFVLLLYLFCALDLATRILQQSTL